MGAMERLDKASNKDFYNSQHPADRERFESRPGKIRSLEIVVPWIVSHLRPGDRVLDVGGGSGAYASQIVRSLPVTVVGLDLAEGMIRQRREDPLLRQNVVGDMESLPFAAESFDALMFIASLHHLPDPRRALAEAWRVLRPGGQLFSYDPNSLRARRTGSLPVDGDPHEFRVWVPWLAGQMRAAGFTVEDVSGRRVAWRVLGGVVKSPSLRAFRAVESIDRLLCLLPGVGLLGEIGMVHARKAA
jgi:SAM-dependent methyltransferase